MTYYERRFLMLIDNTVVYQSEYKIEIGALSKSLFYLFDYDERSYTINMEFQHFHSFYEMCIFLDQKAGHLIEGKWFDLQCCDIVAIRPQLLHKTTYPNGAPNKRLIINFMIPTQIPGLEGYYQQLFHIFDGEAPIYRFEGTVKKIIFDKLNEIFYLSQNRNELTELLIHHKFIEFLSLIYQYQSKNVYVNHVEFDQISNKIYEITSYIHSHYHQPLSLEQLSKDFFISSCYLSHQFKRITGFTLTDYIQMTRIRNAQTLLLTTLEPITEIAFQSGFTSFSHFNRVFHKFVHISPSEFRKKNCIQS